MQKYYKNSFFFFLCGKTGKNIVVYTFLLSKLFPKALLSVVNFEYGKQDKQKQKKTKNRGKKGKLQKVYVKVSFFHSKLFTSFVR